MASFIQIVNWATHQHYKDRNPPWIKLHRELLTSETWVSSSNDDRVLAIAIMMLASECGNKIPANTRYIQRRAYLEREPDLSGLIALKFIEIIEENVDASKPQASARPETETETENRDREQNTEANASDEKSSSPIDLKAAIFASGVPLLQSTGTTDRHARSMLGRWRKDYGDGAVLDALAFAQTVSPSEAIPYITKTLENRSGRQPNSNGALRGTRPNSLVDEYRRALEEERAEFDQASDPGTWPSLSSLGDGGFGSA
jgi:hypothetical protein